MTAPLVTHGVGKRFRRRWALRDCTLAIPERAIVGLAGPNGAGKSTLLGLTVGLLAPTEGQVDVLGRDPRREPEVLASVGYVARDAPLYRSFTVRDTIEFARATNPGWDQSIAGEFLATLSSNDRVSALSAGEKARLALAVALGKRPALLLLDEPFERLDPLAAREFLRLLMDGVSELEATVVIASHVIADIERVSDHIVLLGDGHVRLEGSAEELIASHRLLTGAARPLGRIPGVQEIIRERHSGRQMTLLVRIDGRVVDPSWSVDEIGLEDLLLAYMAPERLPGPRAPERGRLRWHG
jgi:ABC-2 type transport system ATP-binding protein